MAESILKINILQNIANAQQMTVFRELLQAVDATVVLGNLGSKSLDEG